MKNRLMNKFLPLLLVSLSFLLFNTTRSIAQCPPHNNIKAFRDTASLENLQIMAEKFSRCPQNKDTLGFLYYKLVFKSYRSSLFQAIEYTNKAIEAWDGVLADKHPKKLNVVSIQGAFYRKIKNYEQAEKSYKKAIKLLKSTTITEEDSLSLIEYHLQLANCRSDMGDYDAALDYTNIASDFAQQLYDKSSLARTYLVQSKQFLNKKDYEKTIDIATKGINLYSILAPNYNDISGFYINLGAAQYNMGDYTNALLNYTKALGFGKEADNKKNICTCYNNIGLIYTKKKDYKKAKSYFNKIINEQSLFCNDLAYNNLADVYKGQNQLVQAEEFYKKAIFEVSQQETSELNIQVIRYTLERIADKGALIESTQDLAQLYLQKTEKESLQKAQQLYYLLDDIIDAMRKEHYNAESKLFWRNTVHPIYEEAIAVSLDLEKQEEAFYFSEKSKAILLYDKVSENLLQVHLADSLQQKLNSIHQQIIFWERKNDEDIIQAKYRVRNVTRSFHFRETHQYD